MNLQDRNLRQGLTGDDVRPLHTEPTLLDISIPDNERAGAPFGPATLAIIQQFQKRHYLTVTGIVGSAISAESSAQFPLPFNVSGSVHSAQNAGAGGLRIQVVEKNVVPDLLLGFGVT